ncbi:MAG: Mur ligase domain-containing protein [Kiritimatiellia bacterium]
MSRPHVHVSGVGGVGMNAVAQLLLADGVEVTGSDRFLDQGTRLPVFDLLEAEGLTLVPQDGSALRPDSRALVLSTAVEPDNPERRRAGELGIPERHRAEVLADFTRKGPLAAVAGTSGKTSCTGWLGWVLAECGLDPAVVNGGGVLGWKSETRIGNVRLGSADSWWVVEVDESDRSLLRFEPEVALINTLTADHHSFDDTVDLFREFAGKVGRCIVCGPGVKRYLEGAMGISAELREVSNPVDVSLPGVHNRWNAAAVLAMAEVCGCDPEAARMALHSFRGVERRLELCTVPGQNPRVYDDYAHNPEKIGAAIRAVQPTEGKLIALWRPHGFTPLKQNFEAYVDAFADSLRDQDEVWLLPVFYAGGTVPAGVNHQDLVEALQKRSARAVGLEGYPSEIPLAEPDVLLVMGARDPELSRFAREIADNLQETLELLSSPGFREDFERSKHEAEIGDTLSFEEVFGEDQ